MTRHRTACSHLFVCLCAGAFLLLFASASYPQATSAQAPPRTTNFPSSKHPDQVCLTWSGDPCTTQTVQWRTSPKRKKGLIQFREKEAPAQAYTEKAAQMTELADPGTTNDPLNHRFTATLDGLKPGATYVYRVGTKRDWSEWAEFTTAPATATPFSFIYMGDPQVGLEQWGHLVHGAYERNPNAAFYAVAGDNINHGNFRNEWDELFQAATGVFDRRPYVPALGNHDCARAEGPHTYLDLLALPQNGPKEIPPERTYCFNYGNALFLVLDANSPRDAQCAWIEQQLQASKATWKFAIYHQPAYSSAPDRDNPDIRELWGALFDKYHLDMALQGHDHGYLRTKPMRAGQEVASPAEGTVYVVSVSGSKLYNVGEFPYTAKAISRMALYQVIDIQTTPENKLTYRACDAEGNVQDELVIVK